MSEEDPPTQPYYSRRETLVWAGATGVIWLMAGVRTSTQAASDTFHPHCLVSHEQTEGPYFIDERLR
ncbi:MAG TPA: twin-arginine translocation pathway signal protein, partial [Nitrospira sp.]|nr:twin-arginine translocation pathway signal protein [Nitrospira sp.]